MRFLQTSLAVLLLSLNGEAQVSITALNTAMTQNYGGMSVSSCPCSTMPASWVFSESGTGGNTTYAANSGTATAGDTYNYWSGSGSDYSLGSLQSGTVVPTFGVSYTNNTGSTITQLDISYYGEYWRCGTVSRADRLDFQYSLNATSLSTGTWTDFNSLDFDNSGLAAACTTGTAGARDGNAACRKQITASITGLSITNGSTFWIRWNDLNATGADDGMAIDDYSLTAIGSGTPTLSITGNAAAFGNVCTNTTSSSSSLKFTINGTNLTTANVTVAALSGFTYSTTDGGTYTSTLSLSQGGGTYTQDIFVKFSPTAVQSYNGNAVVGGGGASDVNAAITGSGINTTATLNTTPTSASIGTTTATLGGNATTIGCTNLTERGIYWSNTNGFTPPGQGTKVSSTGSFGTGAFTENVTGLPSGTTVYFKSFATNDGGTVYSNQGSFTTLKTEPTNSPTSFACGTTTSSTIPLTWTDASGGTTPDGYLIKWSTTSYAAIADPIDGTAESNGTGVQNITQGTQAHTFTSLASSTTHYFKIWPYTNSGSNIDYKLSPAQTTCATLAGPCANEGFNGGTTTPSGWTFTNIGGTYSTSGNYGAASPSLQMDATGDAVQTPTLSNNATELSFWIKGQATNALSALLVEGWDGSSWVTVENITNSLPTTGTTKTYNSSSSPALPSGLTQFRFTYTKSAGNLAFDDVLAYCNTGTSDIIVNTTYSSSTPYFNINTPYISYVDATSTTAGKVIPMGIEIRDGGASPDADALDTELTGIKFTVKNTSGTNRLSYIKTAILTTTGGTVIATASKVGNELVFSSMSGSNVTASDGGTKILHLRVSFDETQVTDNEKLVFKVTYASSSGSTFAATDAGGAESDNSTGNDRNRIEVVATVLNFVQEATTTATNSSMSPSPTVEAIDANSKRDLDYTTQVSITSTGTLNGSPVNSTPSSGLATFGSIIHTASGTGLYLTASSGSLSTDQSGPFDIGAQTTSTDYFISRVDGNWTTPATWQSSPDQINWITATLAPTQAANTVKISHNVTINSSVTIDQVTVQNGGTITYAGGGSNDLYLNNGAGTDLTIESGGRLLITATNQGLFFTSGSGNPTMLIKTGGMIEAQTSGNGEADGYANDESEYDIVNHYTYDDLITWEDGAILYWNTSDIISAAGRTYFWNTPNATDKPILRFNGASSFVGGNSNTLIYGVLDVSSGATLNWSGTGTKEIVFGITGSGSVGMRTTSPASGQIIISGDGAVLSGGTLTLNSNGLSIPSGADVTLMSNKTIDAGPIAVSGTFDLSDYAISGTYSSFTLAATAIVQTSHVNGLRSATGALQNGSASYNLSFTGSTIEYYRTGAQAVTSNAYYNLVFRGSGDKTMQGNTSVYGDITWLNLGGTPILKCGSYQLDVFGNWSNDSGNNFDRGTGTVNYGSTGNTRTITGANSFNNIKMFGTVNLLGGTQNIYGRIEVPTGSIVNTNGNLTLQSGGSLLHGTGTPLGGGTVNGNVTVKRTGNSGGYIYNYWCSPITSANVSVLGSNLYYYNPANAADLTESGLRAGWVSASGTMTQGLGYISTNGATVSFTGTAGNAPTGTPITVDVKKNVGSSNNVPWNLVGNPFPSSLDADVFISVNGPVAAGGSGAIAGALYFWDDDNSGGDGWATNDYAVWTKAGATPGSPTMSINGRTPNGHIATGQSFFVNKTADGTSTLQFTNAMRSSTNNVFFRQKPIERFWVNISNPNDEINEALIAFIDDATDSVDLLYDAQKLKGNAYISVYTKIGNDDFAIQALPELTQDRVIPVGMDVGTAGNHTFRLSYSENLDETVTLVLEDRLLNHFQCLNEDSDYMFYTDAGTGINRFYIHINPPVQVNVVDESCSGLDGEISIFQPGAKTWDYVLYNDIGQLITSGTGFNGNLSFTGLKGGEYNLALTDQYSFSLLKNIAVTGKTAVLAGFTPDNLVVATDLPVHFTNNSAGATSYEWNFGDGTVLTGIMEPKHAYTQEGTFIVTLKAFNDNCSDLMTQEISAFEVATGSVDEAEDKVYISTIGEYILVRFDYRLEKKAEVTVHNILGQKVFEAETVTSGEMKIDLPGSAGQYYFLTIRKSDKSLTAKIIIPGN